MGYGGDSNPLTRQKTKKTSNFTTLPASGSTCMFCVMLGGLVRDAGMQAESSHGMNIDEVGQSIAALRKIDRSWAQAVGEP